MKKALFIPVALVVGVSMILAAAPGTAVEASKRNKTQNNNSEIAAEIAALEQATAQIRVRKTVRPTGKVLTVAAVPNSSGTSTNNIDSNTNRLKKSRRKSQTATISKKAAEVTQDETKYSGTVGFTVGTDSNIDPGKAGIKDTFFEIAPSLGFTGSIFSGNFGASIRDYSQQETSDIAKKSTANADLSMNLPLSKIAKSTTSIAGKYHDEMWPDFIDENNDGIEDGMPIRYFEVGLTQKINFDFDSSSTEIGGSIKHRDHQNLYSDYASDLLEERRFEQDFNEAKAFARLALKANDNFELAARPSVMQRKFKYREGRQTDGTAGGIAVSAPTHEIITSEIAGDIVVKFAGSSITPTAYIGQTSDEALGAENNSFYGFGISSSLLLNKNLNLKLTPNASYKKASYDNWTRNVAPVDEKRTDTYVTAGVAASLNMNKNVGAQLSYVIFRDKSTMATPDMNYRQEIIGTTLSISF